MLPLLVLLGTIAGAWYLLIVRPQKDQQQRHGAVLNQLKVDDHVLTVGGIYGRVVAIEGNSVVLEFAPGLTSRIVADGIARIVQGPEANLPAAPAASMQVTPTAPQQAHDIVSTPPQNPAPQVPTMHQPDSHQPYQPYQEQPTTQLPLVAHDPNGGMTMRAQVLQSAPWGDVARVNAQPATAYAPAATPQQLPVSGPTMPAQQYAAPQQFAPPVAQFAPPAPQYAPPAPQYAVPQQVSAYAAPVQPRADFLPPPPVILPFGRPAPLQPQQVVQPVVAPQYAAAPAPVALQHAAPQPAVAVPTRRHSAAPEGMGSNLRLDDPSIRDTMERARAERADLASEYRQLTAPLVDTTPMAPAAPQQQYVAAAQTAPGQPQLFAQPAAPQPVMQQQSGHAHPGFAHESTPHGVMPRPNVQAPSEHVDPALTSAFQRRTPYAPEQTGGMPQPALA